VAEWQVAERTEAGMEEQEELVAMALAALLRAKTAQLAVLAVEVAVRVRWRMWAMAREITSRRPPTSTSAVAAISMLFDPAEISLA